MQCPSRSIRSREGERTRFWRRRDCRCSFQARWRCWTRFVTVCLKTVSAGSRAMRFLLAFAITTLVAPPSPAQDRAMSAPERLLDKMTGHWVMTGTIAKKPATHDVDVDWVLKRQYIRIHEVSRDKDASGGVGYEAWIYIVWDANASEYAVMWL